MRVRPNTLPWFRVDPDIVDHPKVHELAYYVGGHPWEALGLLIRLFAWTSKFAPSGTVQPHQIVGMRDSVMGGYGAEAMITGKRFKSDDCPDVDWLPPLLAPFAAAGWLEEGENDTVVVHDWWHMNGSQLQTVQAGEAGRQAGRKLGGTARAQAAQRQLNGTFAPASTPAKPPASNQVNPADGDGDGDGYGDGKTLACDVLPRIDVAVPARTRAATPAVRAARSRRVPDRTLPPEFIAAKAAEHGVPLATAQVLAERLLLEFDSRGYRSARSALITWLAREAANPSPEPHANGHARASPKDGDRHGALVWFSGGWRSTDQAQHLGWRGTG